MSDPTTTPTLPRDLQVLGPTSMIPKEVSIEDRVLERLLSDPDADPDRIREALAIRKEIYDQRRQEKLDQAKEHFFAKLTEAQLEMRRVLTDRDNGQTHSRYATYAQIDRIARPIYTKHGFSVTYNTKRCEIADHVIITALVTNGLYSLDYETPPMLADNKGPQGKPTSMNMMQAVGSSMSYGQRYLSKLIWNLAFINDPDDDDGNMTGVNAGSISVEQVAYINALIGESGVDKDKFLKFGKVAKVEDIPVKQYASAVKMLEERIKAKRDAR